MAGGGTQEGHEPTGSPRPPAAVLGVHLLGREVDAVDHFLDFLLVSKDAGLHGTDLVLLVLDQLLQLGQLGLQGLHGRVGDAARDNTSAVTSATGAPWAPPPALPAPAAVGATGSALLPHYPEEPGP